MEFESPKNISTNEDSVLSAITVSQNISNKFNLTSFAYQHLIKLYQYFPIYFSLFFTSFFIGQWAITKPPNYSDCTSGFHYYCHSRHFWQCSCHYCSFNQHSNEIHHKFADSQFGSCRFAFCLFLCSVYCHGLCLERLALWSYVVPNGSIFDLLHFICQYLYHFSHVYWSIYGSGFSGMYIIHSTFKIAVGKSARKFFNFFLQIMLIMGPDSVKVFSKLLRVFSVFISVCCCLDICISICWNFVLINFVRLLHWSIELSKMLA